MTLQAVNITGIGPRRARGRHLPGMAAGQVKTRRLVVGISGATGIAYGMRVLELAREAGVETHLVVSPPGQQTRAYETPLSAQDLTAMADVSYRPGDPGGGDRLRVVRRRRDDCRAVLGANPGRGRLLQLGQFADRAADVALKERRRLVLRSGRRHCQ
jgi:flavin prenyltransferase